jgi:hypothetical protein
LYDADGNQVAGSSNNRLNFVAEDPGTYYVEATGYGSTGTYYLTVGTYVDDYAGDASTTGEIAAGETRTGEIGLPGDHDWFRISLTEGQTYVMDLWNDGTTLWDPNLTVRDADGNYVDSSWGSLRHTAAATGTFYIDVEDFGGTGTYELSVDLVIV